MQATPPPPRLRKAPEGKAQLPRRRGSAEQRSVNAPIEVAIAAARPCELHQYDINCPHLFQAPYLAIEGLLGRRKAPQAPRDMSWGVCKTFGPSLTPTCSMALRISSEMRAIANPKSSG
eukprot:5623057-Pleurochrysis_carterae.AAC.1